MTSSPARAARRPVAGGLLLAAMVLVALNLRAGVAAVPPLADRIRSDLELSGPQLGLLTALPPLCMGLFAPAGLRLTDRVGRETAVALALVAVAVGSAVRGTASLGWQYAGTLLLGLGIAVAGTALPAVVKEHFPGRPGVVTGVYMAAMMLGAATYAALVVPLATLLGSWRAALASTAVLAVVGLLAWLPVVRRARPDPLARAAGAAPGAPATPVTPAAPATPASRLPWRDRTAWAVCFYLTMQSTIYYTQVAWVPATYTALGYPERTAGLLLAVYTAGQLVVGVTAPALADRVRDLRLILWPLVVLIVLGTAGLAFLPAAAPWLWMVVLGAGLGGAFAMGLVLLVAYAPDPAGSARLAAMAFLVSYAVAAGGPLAFGALLEVTDPRRAWSVVLVLAVLQLASVHVLHPHRTVTSPAALPPMGP